MAGRKRILIVDDEAGWREEILREALEDAGHHVQTRSNYREAVAALNRRCFDLVVVDVNLTGVSGNQDGIRVVERLAKDGGRTPVIVVSGAKTRDAAQQSVEELGSVTFIDKTTFDIAAFVNTVATLSDKSRESIQ